jgi:methylenetetrahydrofolate reductase (NADPH)
MEAGISFATDQIVDLLSAGVSGIHLYVMNNSYVANKIYNNIKDILKGINAK